jgi:ATPase subunit of ABC transporter with duplicated ATPase domains
LPALPGAFDGQLASGCRSIRALRLPVLSSARAALITLLWRSPAVELLILDEPTFSLDLVGQRGLTRALRAWRGRFVVASHDREFLAAIGTEALIELGG